MTLPKSLICLVLLLSVSLAQEVVPCGESAPKNCETCSDASTCTKCKDGFTFTENKKTCATSITNCAVIDNDNNMKCKSCATGFSLTDASLCATTIPNCDVILASNSLKCKSCSTGYSLTDASLCATTIENCDVISSADSKTCKNCKTGFTKTTTGLCATAIANCDVINNTEPKKCSTCSAGFGLTNANLCQKAINRCELIDNTTPANCAKCEIGFNTTTSATVCENVCKNDKDGKTFVKVGTATCTACTDNTEEKLADNVCGPKIIVDVKLSLDGSKIKATYDCGSTTEVEAYAVYSVGAAAAAITVDQAKLISGDPSKRTANQINSWLYAEALGKVTKNTLVLKVKNSGEQYTVVLLCGVRSGSATINSKSNGSKSVLISFNTNAAVTKENRLKLAGNIASFLGIKDDKNAVYTEDGQRGQIAAARILQTPTVNTASFRVDPDWTGEVEDAKIAGFVTKITANEAKDFGTAVVAGIDPALTVNTVKAEAKDALVVAPAMTPEFPAATVDKTTLSFPLKLQNVGTVYFDYYLLGNSTANVEKKIDYDTYIASDDYTKKVKKNSTVFNNVSNYAVFELTGLPTATAYQLFYYGSNNGNPAVYTPVYSQIWSTLPDTKGVESLRWGFVMLAVLVLALLR